MSKKRMAFDRRTFLAGLGLGGAALAVPALRGSVATAAADCPRRVIFLTTQHGPPPRHWKMDLGGLPANADGTVSLDNVPRDQFSLVLDPLYDVRQHIHMLDGLSMLSCMFAAAESPQGNNHGVSWASLMTNSTGNYNNPFVGGAGNIHPRPTAASIDQFIASRTAAPGLLPSVVWGTGGRFGAADGFASNDTSWIPLTRRPQDAYQRLMENGLGEMMPMMMDQPQPPTRDELITAQRSRVLKLAGDQYQQLAPNLGAADRESLTRHLEEIRALEARWTSRPDGGGPGETGLSCDPTYNASGDTMDDFFKLVTIALRCDLTRVVSLNIGELAAADFGAPPTDDVHHAYAHERTDQAVLQMGRYYAHHSAQFASLIRYLEAVPEGDGTLLDNTMVVWVPELSTGQHNFNDCFTMVAGGRASGINLGGYTRFAQNRTPVCTQYGCDGDGIGPGRSHVFVSAMQHMGINENAFNRTSAQDVNGGNVDLTGPLPMLSS